MATSLRRSDPKLSAVLLRNYSYIPSDGIQECLSGTPLIVEGQEYDISSQAFLTRENFKPLLCCVLNACCQHKFMLADRILTAMNACFTVSKHLYASLVDDEYVNNVELIFENITRIKDWDRSIPCVRLLSICSETMMRHKRRGNLDKMHRRILRKMCNSVAKYHMTIDEKGSNTSFELRNLYETVVFMRVFLLLLLSAGINFYIDIEPFQRSLRDTKVLVIIAIAQQYAFNRSSLKMPMWYENIPSKHRRTWRKTVMTVTFTDSKMMDREVPLLDGICGVASFDHVSAIFIPEGKTETIIELPLISCIDVHENDKTLQFYFDINIAYIKGNLPKVLAYGFHDEVGQLYRFCLSCLKKSRMSNDVYDRVVHKFYARDILEMFGLGENLALQHIKKMRRVSYAMIELPLQMMTPSLYCRSQGGSQSGTPHKSLIYMKQEGSLHGAKTPIGGKIDTSFMPASINKVTTTCATGDSIPDNSGNANAQSIGIVEDTAKTSISDVKKASTFRTKISMAILSLPQGEDYQQQLEDNVFMHQPDTIDDSPPPSVVHEEALPIITNVHSPVAEQTVEEEVKRPKRFKLPVKLQTRHHRIKARSKFYRHTSKKRRSATINRSPVPERDYRTRSSCIPLKRDNESTAAPCPRRIVRHLKRATQLLIKRKSHACAYVRQEFDELRHTIETQFHLVLCRCQERWDRTNTVYLQRLGDIMGSIGDDIKLPRLEELSKQLPEPIRLQPPPSVDLCLSTLDKMGTQTSTLI